MSTEKKIQVTRAILVDVLIVPDVDIVLQLST